jgi:XRE family transcriptional regulator, regulator of sulfur utilization
MITRRDLITVALALSVGATLGHGCSWIPLATAGSQPSVQESELFDWNALAPNPTEVGQYRKVLRAPTATLDELEMHITTLNPGQSSHPPHKHPNEELVILASGKLEAMSNGKTRVLGPGSVIFNASNQLHSVRNVGDVPATYHVINWTSPGMRDKPEARDKPEGVPAAPKTK